ncbi:hypothetical protein GA0074695_1527 [Micromonospora viridifaciens]|uniref:Uncharacterized protein n=1 Tax=Micromonospora viridifaciens TaxID=1881 RepID=A0A1C4VJC3_MICVI|nr:hypothetical protein [Micromonospora viridifaciens]SCE84102.1 hypothetical protein GA0074695_1527 [Micromonospora viridifaciens]
MTAYTMSDAARAYRVLPTSRQHYENGQPVKPFRLDKDRLTARYPLGPDAVREEIARQLVAAYGHRATTPGEYRLLVRWVRYRVADEMAARYPASAPQSAPDPASLPVTLAA